MKKSLLCLLTLIPCIYLNAQNLEIFFLSGNAALEKDHYAQLEALSAGLEDLNAFNWKIIGFTDTVGPELENNILSAKRAVSVKKYLIQKGVSDDRIIVWGDGENIAYNPDPGRNRRVELSLSPFDPEPRIQSAMSALKEDPALFCIDPNRDTVLMAPNGTMVAIPAQAFKLPPGLNYANCLAITIDEAFDRKDMILKRLNTTSDGIPLSSEGMILLEASVGGQVLDLAEGKKLTYFLPTDTIRPEMLAWTGERQNDDQVNWENDGVELLGYLEELTDECDSIASVLSRIRKDVCGTTAMLKKCLVVLDSMQQDYRMLCGGTGRDCFLKQWIRKMRLRVAARRGRIQNQRAGRQFARENNLPVPATLAEAEMLDKLVALDAESERIREMLEDFQKVERKLLRSKCGQMNAKNDSLFQKWGLGTVKEAVDSLRHMRKEIALGSNKFGEEISPENLKYYVFTSTDMDWKNIDWMWKYGPKQRTDLIVKMPSDPEYDIMLSFQNSRTVLRGKRGENGFSFGYIPYNEPFILLGMAFKDGKKGLARKELVLKRGEDKVRLDEFEYYSNESFLEELEQLDVVVN